MTIQEDIKQEEEKNIYRYNLAKASNSSSMVEGCASFLIKVLKKRS
jgi:hypothetical protein